MNMPVLDTREVATADAAAGAAADATVIAFVPGESGLSSEQQHKVLQLAERLVAGGLAEVNAYGHEIGRHASDSTDEILEAVGSGDLDAMGAKLSQIVGVAQSLDLGALAGRRSSLPLVGGLVDRFRLKAGELSRRFAEVRSQIDTLVAEVDILQQGLALRTEFLSDSFDSIKSEHAMLQLHIAAGGHASATMRATIDRQGGVASDLSGAQELRELRSTSEALDQRVADMKMLQQAALQQLPMIRVVQANNRMLIDKFNTIREQTVPAWKRQFMVALSLNEQKAMDDLREAHDTLLATVQDLVRTNKEGLLQRASATGQLQALRSAMTRQLNRG